MDFLKIHFLRLFQRKSDLLTPKQLQEQAWVDSVCLFLQGCEAKTATEIKNILKLFPKNPNVNKIVGWMLEKRIQKCELMGDFYLTSRNDLSYRSYLEIQHLYSQQYSCSDSSRHQRRRSSLQCYNHAGV